MKVAIGTIEVSDELAKKINKAAGRSGRAKRDEVREWAQNAIVTAGAQLLDEQPSS